MKGGSPIWTNCVPEVFGEAWIVPAADRQGLAKRIIADAVERYGYGDTPSSWAALASAKAEFPCQRSDGTWVTAPQETTIRHLRWAFEQGHEQAGDCAAISFISYYNSKTWPYLKTGGDENQPYMDAGRCRTARGCVSYTLDLLKMLEASGASGWAIDWLNELLVAHVDRILKHWPLVDQPKGDHLSVPFMSTYQSSTLWAALREVVRWTTDTELAAKCFQMMAFIESLLMTARVEEGDGSWFTYDVAIVDGKPTFIDEMREGINKGVQGVGSWHVPVLQDMADRGHSGGSQCYWAMRKSVSSKFAQQYPDSIAQFFGTVTP